MPRDGRCFISEKSNAFITDVSCGVHVPVETNSAVAALKDAFTEGELGFRPATVRAHLRRGVEPIHPDDAVSSALSFVGELTSKLIEARVLNRTP